MVGVTILLPTRLNRRHWQSVMTFLSSPVSLIAFLHLETFPTMISNAPQSKKEIFSLWTAASAQIRPFPHSIWRTVCLLPMEANTTGEQQPLRLSFSQSHSAFLRSFPWLDLIVGQSTPFVHRTSPGDICLWVSGSMIMLWFFTIYEGHTQDYLLPCPLSSWT